MCVHIALPTQYPPGFLEAALEALEQSYERLVLLTGVHAPARELDWYLDPSELRVELEPLISRGFDRAAAFCRGGARELVRSAHLCVAEASVAAATPAEAPHVRRAYATHLWWQQGLPEEADRRALGRLQAAPEHGVLVRDLGPHSEGAALWFTYLAAQAPSGSGPAATAALELAATKTEAGALRWHAEPDVLDVLRSSLDGSRERVARFWDGFARSRLTVGTEGWLPWAGDEARVTPAWQITTSSFPRHLALPKPLEPTGSVYFFIELDGPLPAFALRASCEAPVSYVWSITRYGPGWQALSTLPIPFREAHPSIEQRVTDLEGVTHVVLSGTSLGGVDLAHPFDPDHEPFEPHGCSVYFSAL